jgi:hypothetical protein
MEGENKNTESAHETTSSIEQSPNSNLAITEEPLHDSGNLSVQNIIPKSDCPSCNAAANSRMSESFVYAIGNVVHSFPNRSIEMELAQAIGQKPEVETRNLTHLEVVSKILSDPNYRYISRKICYVLRIEGLETYILVPSDSSDIDKLVQAIRPDPSPNDIDVIIGRRGPIAPPELCNGLMVPIVSVDQIYSFDRDTLFKAIPKQKGLNEAQSKKNFYALFDNIRQISDNTGAIDKHRVLNYLVVRYDEIYRRTQIMQQDNYSFTGIEVYPSPVSDTRNVLDVIFNYENRSNRAIQRWFVTVDVTEEFPFLVTPMREYFER